MGNGGVVGIRCKDCSSTYYTCDAAEWGISGTITRKRGYCDKCCGGTNTYYTSDGHTVDMLCKKCNSKYNIITWSEWSKSGDYYYSAGHCTSCYNNKYALASLFQSLSLGVMPSVPYRYANNYTSVAYTRDNNLTTKFYDFEFKNDDSDEIQFSLKRDYTVLTNLTSPNSVTLNYKSINRDITILFGTKGSNVHCCISLDTYNNSKGYTSVYHFGLLLSGNTYTVNDNKNKTKSVKNYMMMHLLPNSIVFMLCKTRKRAMMELNSVWCGGAEHGQISHYQRILGHSILSAKLICKFLVKEQKNDEIPYNFKGLKDHYLTLSTHWPKYKLAKITNCFLFVIRFTKLLNMAFTKNKQIIVPTAQNVVDWTIGKQDWLKQDIFKYVWTHGKSLAEPFN